MTEILQHAEDNARKSRGSFNILNNMDEAFYNDDIV